MQKIVMSLGAPSEKRPTHALSQRTHHVLGSAAKAEHGSQSRPALETSDQVECWKRRPVKAALLQLEATHGQCLPMPRAALPTPQLAPDAARAK
jgi:hypothetical protein